MNSSMLHIRVVLSVITVIMVSMQGCLPTPTDIATPEGRVDGAGVFVLCEGLWRQDNSTLCFIGDDGSVVRDVVGTFNPGLRLGDTGTDIHLRGDSIWVVVSTSRSIELFHRRTGKWLDRLRFDDLREPYAMAFVNDSVAVCTFLNDASIAEFNPRRMRERVARVPVGPAPEGIAVMADRIYVANSGLGDLRRFEQGAGTVTVLSASDLAPIDTIAGLPNVRTIVADPRAGRVWCIYRHFVSSPDSLGGVVAYDPASGRIVEHHRLRSPVSASIDPATGGLYVLHASGISRIVGGRIVSVAERTSSSAWYCLKWDERAGRLIIGNARTYVTNGEVIFMDTAGAVLRRYDVGINPGSIAIGD